jgi:hypothetical protein
MDASGGKAHIYQNKHYIKYSSSMTYNELLQLIHETHQSNQAKVQSLLEKWTPAQLAWKPTPEKWSAYELFAHLAVANLPYLDQFDDLVPKLKPAGGNEAMRTGYFGGKLIGFIKKQDNKLKAPKVFQPVEQSNSRISVDAYKNAVRRFEGILPQLVNKNLSAPKTKTPVTSLVRPKLGDALQIIAFHDQRHINQILRLATLDQFPKA